MRHGRDPYAGLCDWCGHSLVHYNHDGCPDGLGAEVLTDSATCGVVDPWKRLLDGPGAERQT